MSGGVSRRARLGWGLIVSSVLVGLLSWVPKACFNGLSLLALLCALGGALVLESPVGSALVDRPVTGPEEGPR